MGLFIKNDVSYHITNKYSLSLPNTEELWVEVENYKGHKKLFGIIYRHPVNSEIRSFQCRFADVIYNLNSSNTNYFILGDFNYCLLKDINNDFVSTILNLGCEQLVKTPTHPNPVQDSLIDHIYTNCCDKKIIVDVIKEGITDHHIIHMKIGIFPQMSTKITILRKIIHHRLLIFRIQQKLIIYFG